MPRRAFWLGLAVAVHRPATVGFPGRARRDEQEAREIPGRTTPLELFRPGAGLSRPARRIGPMRPARLRGDPRLSSVDGLCWKSRRGRPTSSAARICWSRPGVRSTPSFRATLSMRSPAQALMQLARLLVERGHIAASQAEDPETRGIRPAKLAEARAAFDQARTAYDRPAAGSRRLRQLPGLPPRQRRPPQGPGGAHIALCRSNCKRRSSTTRRATRTPSAPRSEPTCWTSRRPSSTTFTTDTAPDGRLDRAHVAGEVLEEQGEYRQGDGHLQWADGAAQPAGPADPAVRWILPNHCDAQAERVRPRR